MSNSEGFAFGSSSNISMARQVRHNVVSKCRLPAYRVCWPTRMMVYKEGGCY